MASYRINDVSDVQTSIDEHGRELYTLLEFPP